jgi:hypothetical protein
MADTFNVTAALDKASYNAGDMMTLTINGGDVLTTTTSTANPVSGTVHLVAADGVTQDVAFSGATVTTTTTNSTPESVKITSVSDSSGRVWTISASGLTATAMA